MNVVRIRSSAMLVRTSQKKEGVKKEVSAGKRSYICGLFIPFFVKRARDRRSTEDTPVSSPFSMAAIESEAPALP